MYFSQRMRERGSLSLKKDKRGDMLSAKSILHFPKDSSLVILRVFVVGVLFNLEI